MAGGDKPYRVYRGGRAKGKVPLPHRVRAQQEKQRRTAQPDGAPRYPGPGPARPDRRPGWGRRIGIVLLVVCLLLLVWGVASWFAVRGGVRSANSRLSESAKAALAHQDSLILSSPTDILVLGTDHANQRGHEQANRADSIMVIRTDPDRHRISYLSIPRDLRVPIPGIGDGRVNSAMQTGGAALAIRTIASYTGLPLNHVIVADFSQFSDVIDALGGVTIDVPEPIISKFDCPYPTEERCRSWDGWRFAKGKHHMNGKRALIYSRVRKNVLNAADTDITRTERQQQVLQAMLKAMTSVGTLAKLPFVGGKLVRPLATDLSTAQLMQIAWVYRRAHALHCRLGGQPETIGGESVIVAEGDDKSRVVLAMLGKTAPLPPRPGEGPYGAGCVSGSFPR
jgi:LCP family protein required for cell wall assembly